MGKKKNVIVTEYRWFSSVFIVAPRCVRDVENYGTRSIDGLIDFRSTMKVEIRGYNLQK